MSTGAPKADTVVLTGAGFSVSAGLPTADQLVARGRQRLCADVLEALDALASQVLEEPISKEVEVALTRLRVLELYSKKFDYMTQLLPLELGIYYLVWAPLRLENEPPTLYDTFIEKLGNGANVAFATLNYDLLLESIFRRRQLTWHYALQGEANSENELRYRDALYAPFGQEALSIPYLKLHGSFNWHYCWRCDYFRIVPEEWYGVSTFHLPRAGRDPLRVASRGTLACIRCPQASGQAALKPLIIPPSRLKEYTRAPVRRLWAFFDVLLARAKRLIIVGTSLRDEDVLLVNCLGYLQLKNSSLSEVVVVDPSGESRRRAETLTGLSARWYLTLADFNEQYMDDFV
jgi:hypothetical protein